MMKTALIIVDMQKAMQSSALPPRNNLIAEPLATEHVVEKNVPDAFVNTGLERWLHARGIVQVVLVGVSTNNSIEATARSAGNLGFKTIVVSDATFAFAKTDYAGNRRTADEVHAMSLANLDGEYASIVSANSLLADPV
jgi:nicotinamidase-related amidase